MANAILDAVNKLATRMDRMEDQIKANSGRRNAGVIGTGDSFNDGVAPYGRRGEDIMSSRGFSFQKLMSCRGYNANQKDEVAKIELDLCGRFAQKMMSIPGGWVPKHRDSVLIPLCEQWLTPVEKQAIGYDMVHEIKSIMDAGVAGCDSGEIRYWQQKMLDAAGLGQKVGNDPDELRFYNEFREFRDKQLTGQKAAVTPTLPMSWVNEGIGGSFVPPALQGPAIDLLRNQSAFLNSGATVVPLPPQGTAVYPRMTSAPQGGWLGENTAGTPSQPSTGQLTLRAKKAYSLVIFPAESLRFASPALEQMIRSQMFQTVSLTFDLAAIYGQGSDNVPLGVVTQAYPTAPAVNPGIGIVTPSTSATQLAGQDIYQFLSLIEQHNGQGIYAPTNWIMNPKMLYGIAQGRWTSYSAGLNTGGFLFDFTRGMDGKVTPTLAGLPVTKTNQISLNRNAGSYGAPNAGTTVICLNGPQMLMGIWGALEWSQTDGGIQLFAADQVAVRALLTCDSGASQPGLISLVDGVSPSIAD